MHYEKVAVVGTGTMGPGIGAVLAAAGSEVTLHDVSPDALERARGGLELATGILDKLGAVGPHRPSVSFSDALAEAVSNASLVIEAVPENLELKQRVFADIESHVDGTSVLASNTSGVSITAIAENLRHPERVLGMHWSNPPHLIPMIEVIPGNATATNTTSDLVAFIESFGYRAVVEREVPGFVENRILYAILREAVALVEQGIISQADMDTCVKWGIGYKLAVIGPMELLDMAGLDIYSSVGSYLNPDLSTAKDVSPFITKLVEQDRLGIKTLGGIYDYTAEEAAKRTVERASKLIAVRRALDS